MSASRIARRLITNGLAAQSRPLSTFHSSISSGLISASQSRLSSTSASLIQEQSSTEHTQIEATSSQLFITWPNGRRTAL